jgi:parallel beta-helix repeat protein
MMSLFIMSPIETATTLGKPSAEAIGTSEPGQFSQSVLASNGTGYQKGEDGKQLQIAEHRITVSEAQRLKQEIGVYTPGENYSKSVDGYGTGWRPPTEEEWAQLADNGYIIDKISQEGTISAPSVVDHSKEPWFPPIGNQGSEGSCTCWAVGYYMKTYQEASEHSWNLTGAVWDGTQPSIEYQDRIISPAFIYNLVNGGVDDGSSPITAINMICSIGASSWEKMPYQVGDYTNWPSEEAWREAPLYRGASSGYESLYVTNDSDLILLKDRIASGSLAATNLDGSKIAGPFGSYLTSNDALTLDNYGPPFDYTKWHEVTIVGYDDNFQYTEQGEVRHGAFKIANSWGVGGFMGWENVPDGYFWISYEAMKQRIHWGEFYNDKIGYEPELAASFRITHSKRGECNVTVGVGSQTKCFNQWIDGGDQPFCSNDILFDITEFKNAIPNVIGQQFYLKVYDGGSSTTGTITKFAVEYEESNDTPVTTVNYGTVYDYVTLHYLETNWRSGNLVHSDNDSVDNKVSMATDSNGYFYVAYEDWYPAGGKQAIFLERSVDGGRTWSVLTQWYWVAYDCHNPSIAIDPYDNKVYVAYELEISTSQHDIYCCAYTPATGEKHVRVDTGTGDDRFPSVTSEYQYGSANWQYISYEYVYNYDDRDLMFAKSTDHGTTWSAKKLHGDWPDFNVHAQTSITNAEGNIYIAYKWGADYNSACEIRVDRSTDFGSSWTQVTDVDGLPNGCSFPSIAATRGGDCVIVAFQYAYSASDTDIWYSYSMDKGSNWVKRCQLFTSSVCNEETPVLAVDGGGSTRNDVGGFVHVACKVGSYIEYASSSYASLYFLNSKVLVSDRWVGKGLAITTQYKNITNEFNPSIVWTDERTNDIYYSTTGHVYNLNNEIKYDSIQEAIDANETTTGNILLAESRIYNEKVLINKSITVRGENSQDTVIQTEAFSAVEVAANDSVLENFTVKGAVIGVDVHSCSNTTVRDNLVTGNQIGIALDYYSSNNVLTENNVTLNSWYGVWILRSPGNLLRNNSMASNKFNLGVQGDEPSTFAQDIDASNTVDNKPVQYWINQENKTVPANAGYVGLINCTQITLQNVKLEDNGEGVLLAYTINSTIFGNNITNNECGIRLYASSANIVDENNVSANEVQGIQLYGSVDNRVIKNSIGANWQGVSFVESSNNHLIENNIETNNNASIVFLNSSDNLFFHNNFMNNVAGISDLALDLPAYNWSRNTWDNGYPSGGNYWSNYWGVDNYSGPYQNETGSDGIGDTPYVIDVNNTDHYPLMNPYSTNSLSVTISPISSTSDVSQSQLFTSSVVGGTLPYTYQWYLNGAPVSGATGATWTFTPTFGGSYTVYLEIADVASAIATSNTATVTVNGACIIVDPTLSLFTAPSMVVGSTFNINVSLVNVTNVAGLDFELTWDPTLLNCTNMMEVLFHTKTPSADWGNIQPYAFYINNNAGYARYSYSWLNLGAALAAGYAPINVTTTTDPPEGKLAVAMLTFQVLQVPTMAQGNLTCAFHLSNVVIGDPDANSISAGAGDGTYIIAPLSASISPVSATLDVGGHSQLFTSVVSGGTSLYTYQWYLNYAPVSGATSDSWTFTPTSNGSYTVYLNVTDSAGVSAISNASTVNVNAPPSVSILPSSVVMDVNQSQTFTSTVSGGTLPYTYQWCLNDIAVLGANLSSWTFTPNLTGSYTIYANVTDSVGVQATSNTANVTVNIGTHDVAVTSVVSSKTVVGQGFSASINVTVANQGDFTETINVTAYANATSIRSENVTLPADNSMTVTFTWNTIGFAYGNYTLSAFALPIPGENNTANNNLTGGIVKVTIPGDFNDDGIANILDAIRLGNAFLSKPGDPNWNPNADINNDGIVNILDAIILGNHFLQSASYDP